MIPIYKIELGECDGVTKMSLVKYPAVESNFLAFSEEKKKDLNFSIDEEKHNIFGVALRANYPIYRYDKSMGEYYVVFTPEVIDELYQKFMIEYKDTNVNLEHSIETDGVYLIQSLIKGNGIVPNGFDDIEDGSWFVMYHIDNDKVWNGIKKGEFAGFSVECFVELSNEPIDDVDLIINDILD